MLYFGHIVNIVYCFNMSDLEIKNQVTQKETRIIFPIILLHLKSKLIRAHNEPEIQYPDRTFSFNCYAYLGHNMPFNGCNFDGF